MKKLLALLFALGALYPVAAQDSLASLLGPLESDIAALMAGIGEDVAPHLLQSVLSADIVGDAALGEPESGGFPHCSISLLGVGLTLGNGIATVLNPGARAWEFILPLPSLISGAVGSSGTGADVYAASRQAFPYPGLSFGLGFGLAADFELLANGFLIPQALTDSIAGMDPTLAKLAPSFSSATIILKARKAFLRGEGWFPAMSISLAGLYSSLGAGASVKLSDLAGAVDISGVGSLDLTGPLSFSTRVYGAGLEFHISKRLPLITPFAKIGIWYQNAEASTDINLLATITPSNTAIAAVEKTIVANPVTTISDFSMIITSGMEIRIFAFIIHLSASLDLESPLLNIQSFSLTGIAANDVSINFGLRLAF